MKVALLLPSLLPTGPVRVALDQAAGLRIRGHQVQLFYFDAKPGAVEDVGAQRISFFQRIDLLGFDVLHTHGLRPDAFVWWHKPSITTVTTFHNYAEIDLGFIYPKIIAKTAAWIWRIFTQKHSLRLALSHHMKTYYEKKGWQTPIEILHNSRPAPIGLPDENLQKEVQSFAAGRVILGNISHVTPRKGLEQIIDLLVVEKSFVFVHIGSGSEDLEQYAAEKGVAGCCLWLGAQTNAAQLFPLFDVFVMPSYSEGFPLALLEAVAAKVPAVVSDLPLFETLFSEDAVGRFQLHNTEHLQQTISKVLATAQERRTKAFAQYQKNFTPEVIAEKLEEIYAELVSASK